MAQISKTRGEEISFNCTQESLIEWLETQAKEYQFKYLLAHADDGVIWGKFDSECLVTADEVFDRDTFNVNLPSLRLSTLQQCRIFGENGEILLWKTTNKWKARLCSDLNLEKIPESQLLWGTHGQKHQGFTLLRDGSQGLRHAVPFTDIDLKRNGVLSNPVQLVVYHYIDYDDDGIAKIVLSRLVNLTTKKEEV